jgi:hypothetical protein
MSERRFSLGDMRWSIAIAPALVVLVLGSFLIFATDSEPKRGSGAGRERSLAEAPSAIEESTPEGAWVTAKEAKKATEPVLASKPEGQDDIIGPHAGDPLGPRMHPHPITPEHQRIDAINQTIQSLNDAMSFRDVRKMRELVGAYRSLDPDDVDQSQRGYLTIADCIEHPGEASLANAKDFYANQRHSPLRRFVRRICFENQD